MSLFYGSTYDLNENVHHFDILHVDYDGGVVGQALQMAYDQLRGDHFPTLISGSPQDIVVSELGARVCHDRHVWGAIYTASGASQRLSSALTGGDAAEEYNSSNAITFIWNSARYPTLSEGDIQGNLQSLIFGSNTAYFLLNGTYAYGNINTSSKAALQALAQPFNPLSMIDIHPTDQGSRVLYNTVTTVITIITQFFFVMAINETDHTFHIFSRLGLTRNLKIRWISSFVYSASLAASLVGVIWAFRGHWDVTAAQGVETWLVILWACHINFLVFDTVTGWVPQHLIAFFVLAWIIVNITSTVVPLELAPGFYHYQYAVPSFEVYQLLTTVWSRGCVPQNFRAIPILFTWWLLGFVGSWASMVQKCNRAEPELRELSRTDREKVLPSSPSPNRTGTEVDGVVKEQAGA